MEQLRLVLISSENVELAITLAREIFPYEISRSGIFLPEQEYRMALLPSRANQQEFFIAFSNEMPVGITGYNYHYRRPKTDELWLGYFGIKKDFRGNGLGKKILLETLMLARKFNPNLRTVKLYTSNREEERGSHHLYRCVGFKVYAHKNTRPYQTYYFRL